mmetsp:Transcript_24406/g.29584  ORF Transcript_24406/g.29584 Transcript_24406/m.29584 type:complete len:219 (-) Transcript_24406:412-1068(-)|eukprot:CAMPEP_0197853508 /NCGR_PEP_ID=MMETSP1438-20131217/22867_1 /TAXON_ID=1461541 /ORGANISM="Pterosperma sp., Strain CCMP1384" /LENGTH=218 /DNA_ID=CAMNT_0043467943 /DNA_START=181 /DNA_END=837 /DNA_ORIENTATION=+
MTKVDLKVVLLGQANVGKSCLVDRFLNGKFDHSQKNTIGAAFGAKKLFLENGRTITLGIWDTAGAERFESLSRVYYHSAGAALVCFDPSKQESWDKTKFWVKELLENEQRCRIYIVETKQDALEEGTAERVVDSSEVEAYTSTVNGKVFSTSAMTGYNVVEMFQCIATDADTTPSDLRPYNTPGTVRFQNSTGYSTMSIQNPNTPATRGGRRAANSCC